MKKLWLLGLLWPVIASSMRADEVKFTRELSPEELAAAGLTGLTNEQRAKLDELVDRYRSGELAAARRAARDALAAKQAAEAAAAQAAADARAADARAAKAVAASAEAARKENAGEAKPGFLTKAKGIFKSDPKRDAPLVESTLKGKFRGWAPRQVFTLANGQRWQVANNESYYSPLVENPKVEILPAALFGYWLRFPEVGAQVRVNFVSE